MQAYYYPSIVTLLIALAYFWMALTVSGRMPAPASLRQR
jgi:hypothetical protein